MRLDQVFSGPPGDLVWRASAYEQWEEFIDAVDRQPAAPAATRLLIQAGPLAANLEERADTGVSSGALTNGGRERLIFAGQQAYIDYRLGMVAKVDALELCRPPAFCALVEHDGFGSDRLFSCTDLPRVDRGTAKRLTLRFHPGKRAFGKRDLRFVPSPGAETLERIRADLRGTITLTVRAVPGFDARAARERLDELWADYTFARERARHAGDFNLLWTVRTLRRLGYRTPMLALGELWDAPGMMEIIAETLVPFVRENERFVEAANEAIRLAAPHNGGMSPREPGHLPLSMTDPATGIRFGLRVARRGVDSVIVGTGPVPFAHDVGRAGQDELLMFLHAHRGRCSPNVFAPIFLFRAGVSGILNGRGAIRYSLVLANVMARLFDLSHPPNFLCAGEACVEDPFALARAAAGAPPADVEPTLLSRLLAVGPATVRREVSEVWR